MADVVADITKISGPIVWRGTMLRFSGREDCYVKLARMGKRSATIGFSSMELLDLRDLIKEMITAEEEG